MNSQDHWEKVYASKATDAVSWFQQHAQLSLELIAATGVGKSAAIIDVGGGASNLVDDLLALGYANLHVLDISAAALFATKHRLGTRAAEIKWLVADITRADFQAAYFDVWHDRAVFHFLVTPEERAAYIAIVLRSVKPGGHVIIATFAEDGPTQCSGLPVMRYSASSLQAEFGDSFSLLHQQKESHRTPTGVLQKFVYCYFRKAVK
jgi:ubiquinone/menaquinone biosynthesis C-methylase UbiE